jgi:HKD family nuclease
MTIEIVANSLHKYLIPLLPRCESADFAIAFLKSSGTDLLSPLFTRLKEEQKRFRVVFSNAFGLTEPKALSDLLNFGARLRVFRPIEEDAGIFHSKLWILYLDKGEVAVIIGSSNMTRAALVGNTELNVSIIGRRTDKVIAECLMLFDRLWLSPNSEAVASDFIDDYAKSRPIIMQRNKESNKEIDRIIRQRALTHESVNKQFSGMILKALKAGPATTSMLYELAREELPHLCESLDDWYHSLRGAQSSLKNSRRIRRGTNGNWQLSS